MKHHSRWRIKIKAIFFSVEMERAGDPLLPRGWFASGLRAVRGWLTDNFGLTDFNRQRSAQLKRQDPWLESSLFYWLSMVPFSFFAVLLAALAVGLRQDVPVGLLATGAADAVLVLAFGRYLQVQGDKARPTQGLKTAD